MLNIIFIMLFLIKKKLKKVFFDGLIICQSKSGN